MVGRMNKDGKTDRKSPWWKEHWVKGGIPVTVLLLITVIFYYLDLKGYTFPVMFHDLMTLLVFAVLSYTTYYIVAEKLWVRGGIALGMLMLVTAIFYYLGFGYTFPTTLQDLLLLLVFAVLPPLLHYSATEGLSKDIRRNMGKIVYTVFGTVALGFLVWILAMVTVGFLIEDLLASPGWWDQYHGDSLLFLWSYATGTYLGYWLGKRRGFKLQGLETSREE